MALARLGGAEARVAGGNREARRDVLLSTAEARKVTACLAADRAAWPAVVPRPNPTLRPGLPPDDEGFYTFWRPSSPRREGDEEVRSRARAQPVLDLFLAAAARGTLAVPELLAAVAAASGREVAELAAFLVRLAEAGLLIAEIEPPYNARRPLAHLAASLAAAGCAPPWRGEIEAVERAVDELPALAPEARLAAMDAIESRLAALPRRRPLAGDELFRVDTASGLEVTLPGAVLDELRGPVGRYVRLFAAMYPEPVFRAAWGRKFLSRFPADRDVPVLDLYHGLFEPEPEERPAAFPAVPEGDPAAAAVAERARGLLAGLARQAAAAGAEEVALDDAFFAAAGALPAEPPWAAGVLFQVAAADAAAVAAGRYRLAVNAFFGAGIALARFAWLLGEGGEPSPAIVREVARYAAPLAPPGAIVAEITYNHLGRSANAGLRPTIFGHEIELPGERASPGAEAIALADLVVRWDAAAGRFVLRSLARGAEVVPVISSGISPEGFISFLVEIGRQGLQPLAHFPGFDVPGVTRWPRFTLGRVVLWRRRWIFPPGTAPEVPAALREAGRRRRWPRCRGRALRPHRALAARPRPAAPRLPPHRGRPQALLRRPRIAALGRAAAADALPRRGAAGAGTPCDRDAPRPRRDVGAGRSRPLRGGVPRPDVGAGLIRSHRDA